VTVESPVIDALDKVILSELQADSRISWRELGDRVGLGATATADRVRRLIDLGIIARFTTVIDATALGIGLRAIVDVRLSPGTPGELFEQRLRAHSEVQSACHLTGPFDFMVQVACPDVARLDQMLRGWKSDGLVGESNTRILLAEIDLTES
jgi:Lrp/AsnC family leucine-responsive transcriptional regulator